MSSAELTNPPKMRACADRVDDIHRFLDGETHPREQAALNEHFESCAGCDEYRREFHRWVEATGEALRAPDIQCESEKSPLTKRRVLEGVDRQLRSGVTERLGDLAKSRYLKAIVPPTHISSTSVGPGATIRRIQDLANQRLALGPQKRSVHGPWAELKDLSVKKETVDHSQALLEGGFEHLERALMFAVDSGRTQLLRATYARVLGDESVVWEGAAAAAQGNEVKVRSMGHIALAHLHLGRQDFRSALSHLEGAHVYDETSPWPFYGQAIAAFGSGNTREARRRLDVLAGVLQKQRKPDEMKRSLRGFLDADVANLGQTQGIGRLKAMHFSRLVTQAVGDLPSAEDEVDLGVLHATVDGLGPWEIH